jgi:hypothetical protein
MIDSNFRWSGISTMGRSTAAPRGAVHSVPTKQPPLPIEDEDEDDD